MKNRADRLHMVVGAKCLTKLEDGDMNSKERSTMDFLKKEKHR